MHYIVLVLEAPRIKTQYVYRRRRKHGEAPIVRIHVLVILNQTAHSSDALCILVVLLLRLHWPVRDDDESTSYD